MRVARQTAAAAVTAAVLSALAVRSADAAIVIVGQSRSVSTAAVTNAVPAYPVQGSPTTVSDPHANTSTTAGPYTMAVSSNADQVVGGDGMSPQTQTYTFDASSAANQSSGVSAAALTGTGGAGAFSYKAAGFSGDAGANGSSGYAVMFTVDVPTAVTLGGTLTGASAYHLGPLEVVADAVLLSGSASGTLFSRSDNFTPIQTTGVQTFGDPFSYAGLLLPGQTYTLSASAYAASRRDSVGMTSNTGGTAGFDLSLTAAVPEPATAGLAGMAAVGLLARRRRR